MEITKDLLLQKGVEERMIDGRTVYVKGHIALVHNLNMWIPYRTGGQVPVTLSLHPLQDLQHRLSKALVTGTCPRLPPVGYDVYSVNESE